MGQIISRYLDRFGRGGLDYFRLETTFHLLSIVDNMPNPHLLCRLEAVQNTLISLHHGGATMSSSTKGREREDFNHGFLEQVLPPGFRGHDAQLPTDAPETP